MDESIYFCSECDLEFSNGDSRLGNELFCPLCKNRLESYTPLKHLSKAETKMNESDKNEAQKTKMGCCESCKEEKKGQFYKFY
jgi:hypothetical protein